MDFKATAVQLAIDCVTPITGQGTVDTKMIEEALEIAYLEGRRYQAEEDANIVEAASDELSKGRDGAILGLGINLLAHKLKEAAKKIGSER